VTRSCALICGVLFACDGPRVGVLDDAGAAPPERDGSGAAEGPPDANEPAPTPQGFPTTLVLDDFEQAAANLRDQWFNGFGHSRVENGRVVCAELCLVPLIWNRAFGARQEVYATLANFEAADALTISLIVWSEAPTLEGTEDSLLVTYLPGYGEIILQALVNSGTESGGALDATFEPGDQFGARAHPSGDIEVFRNGGALGILNVDYPHREGRIGVVGHTPNSGLALDDFGGGEW
jgi:hypothetical protein